ncbi:hypothetical protein MtrunA17_Chr1g0199201 [Medicago truncatula]|uniref:Transmembrane protein, putative n=1 Tax=Medicago truncatula TaxID=3880 RepID=A0A072VPA9_MEDTR|nr:transmembrane protein, putative [Medicago truncatula]RHN81449.1 hypothetical protein MtrunA17_Chr1g0199201 [Medicago truncatula]
MLLPVFLVRWFDGVVLSLSLVVGIFTVAASSECYGDVADFLGDLQLCLALVLDGRVVVVVVVVRVTQWWL